MATKKRKKKIRRKVVNAKKSVRKKPRKRSVVHRRTSKPKRRKKVAPRRDKRGRFVAKKRKAVPKRTPRKAKKTPRLLSYLLSFRYTPRKRERKQGGGSALAVDFIVAGAAALAERDPVEVYRVLIEKVIRELPLQQRWLARLAQSEMENENAEVDASVIPRLKPPKRAYIRSAYRGKTHLYGSETAEIE